jgi:dolichyl-phosphate-mannose--protein O-mannosyl transferase
MISRTFDSSFTKIFDASKAALRAIGAEIKHTNKKRGTIVASFGFSLFSWGEEIQIIINKRSEERTEVIIESNSENQLIDWGKNSKNEKEFARELLKFLKRK